MHLMDIFYCLHLYNLTFYLVAVRAKLTFTHNVDSGTYEYGTLDNALYPIMSYESMQDWLMDPDACPTTWPELLRIRSENANYQQHT